MEWGVAVWHIYEEFSWTYPMQVTSIDAVVVALPSASFTHTTFFFFYQQVKKKTLGFPYSGFI